MRSARPASCVRIVGPAARQQGHDRLGRHRFDQTRSSRISGRAPGIAFVPQGREIFPLLATEKENLKTGFAPLKRDERDIPDAVFSLFPVLQSCRPAGRRPLRRPAATARDRPCAGDAPKLLLLDEPTEGIQPSIIKDIGRAISYLRGLGNIAIVLVEQYFDFAANWVTTLWRWIAAWSFQPATISPGQSLDQARNGAVAFFSVPCDEAGGGFYYWRRSGSSDLRPIPGALTGEEIARRYVGVHRNKKGLCGQPGRGSVLSTRRGGGQDPPPAARRKRGRYAPVSLDLRQRHSR